MTDVVHNDLVIIGGGVTGLAAAYRAHQQNPLLKITLLEASDYLGGKIMTEEINGFTLEGGPDCFLSRKPRGIGLCEALGVTAELQGRKPAEHKAYVWRNGRLHTLPEGLSGMIPTQLEPLLNHTLLTPEGAQRVAQEPEIPVKESDEDEAVGTFVSRRFGREAFENLIEPLMGGIYAGQADQLSLEATFPQLRQVELKHGSLIKGLGNNTAAQDVYYPPFVSFKQGMVGLVQHIVERLGDSVSIYLNTKATQIKQTAAGDWLITTQDNQSKMPLDATLRPENLKSKTLILATPAFINAKLLSEVAPQAAVAHAEIPYASTALVNFAYDTAALPKLPEGYGYVTPQVEKRDALACTWTSQKWDHRAPEGKTLLRVYIGRYGEGDVTKLNDDTLVDIAQREIRETLGITAAPQLRHIFRWPNGLPQYNLGHLERLQRIDEELGQLSGLYVAGAAYNGVGIPDCIKSGEAAAEKVLAILT
ncbi:MAG: protoporphyrinogen oxidase [Anaerolineales bacterium]|nr:protoporphyrinogen oxidase [Anaerolineales bacterium]